MRLLVLASLLLLTLPILTLPVLAQPPAETCGVGDSLGQSDTLPVDLALAPATDDFEMSVAGCAERGIDHVTCFTPTESCTVNVSCSDADEFSGSGELLGLQLGTNITEGACTTTPASCLASDSATGTSTVSGLALTAGTRYCFICEVDFPISMRLQVTTASGDCGALPVSLQSFRID